MKKTLALFIGLLFSSPAFALNVPSEWTVCEVDIDCTSGIKDCTYWQPVNLKYEAELLGQLKPCEASVFMAGFQPLVKCVKNQCVDTGDVTNVSVRDWFRNHKDKLFGSLESTLF